MTANSRALAREMLRKPLSALNSQAWDRTAADDLRRFLQQRLEYHLERRVRSLQLLERLD